MLIFSLSYNKKTNNLVLPIIALSVFVIFAIVDEVFGKKNKKYQEKAVIGLKWDNDNPRIQLEPIGTRRYIELRAVKQ